MLQNYYFKQLDPSSQYACSSEGYFPFDHDCVRFYKCSVTTENTLIGTFFYEIHKIIKPLKYFDRSASSLFKFQRSARLLFKYSLRMKGNQNLNYLLQMKTAILAYEEDES